MITPGCSRTASIDVVEYAYRRRFLKTHAGGSGQNKTRQIRSPHAFPRHAGPKKSSSGSWVILLSPPSRPDFAGSGHLGISSPITAAGPPGIFTLFRFSSGSTLYTCENQVIFGKPFLRGNDRTIQNMRNPRVIRGGKENRGV